MNDKNYFNEGYVKLNSEIIKLRQITIDPIPSNRVIAPVETADGNVNMILLKSKFTVKEFDNHNINKLFGMTFSIELDNGPTLNGCKINILDSAAKVINGTYDPN